MSFDRLFQPALPNLRKPKPTIKLNKLMDFREEQATEFLRQYLANGGRLSDPEEDFLEYYEESSDGTFSYFDFIDAIEAALDSADEPDEPRPSGMLPKTDWELPDPDYDV